MGSAASAATATQRLNITQKIKHVNRRI